MRKILFFTLFALFIPHSLLALPLISTERLKVMDPDKIKYYLDQNLKEAKAIRSRTMIAKEGDSADQEKLGIEEARLTLKDGMRLLFSRDGSDTLSEQYIEIYKGELREREGFIKNLAQLAGEATEKMQNNKNALKVRSTFLTVLENILSECKPHLKDKPKYRTIVEKIRKANIEMTDDLKEFRTLNSMDPTVSPSETAKDLLDKNPAQEKEKSKGTNEEKS